MRAGGGRLSLLRAALVRGQGRAGDSDGLARGDLNAGGEGKVPGDGDDRRVPGQRAQRYRYVRARDRDRGLLLC